MKKIIPYWFLLSCLTALVNYPNRLEISAFFVLGSGIFLLLAFGVCKIMNNYEFTRTKYSMKNIIGFSIPIGVALYAICFLNVFIVSLFEKRIIWNVFETNRGKAYAIFDLSLLILFIIYCGSFYLRYHRWPTMDEIDKKIG